MEQNRALIRAAFIIIVLAGILLAKLIIELPLLSIGALIVINGYWVIKNKLRRH